MEACDIIANALARFGYEQILAEPLMYHGLVKHVEIIGEAIYMLSKELKQDNPQIEWQAIEDLRHILVHDYYRINPKMLIHNSATELWIKFKHPLRKKRVYHKSLHYDTPSF